MVFERFFLPIFLLYMYSNNDEAKASERSENERKYYARPAHMKLADNVSQNSLNTFASESPATCIRNSLK